MKYLVIYIEIHISEHKIGFNNSTNIQESINNNSLKYLYFHRTMQSNII